MLKSLLSISLVAATTVTLINFPITSASSADSRLTCYQDRISNENQGQFNKDTGVVALTRQRSINAFRRAEFYYSCSKNEEKLAQVRERIRNVDQINFAKNRSTVISQLKLLITSMREAKVHEGAIRNAQARIKEIEGMRD